MKDWKWFYFVGIILGILTGIGIIGWILYKDDIRAKLAEGPAIAARIKNEAESEDEESV